MPGNKNIYCLKEDLLCSIRSESFCFYLEQKLYRSNKMFCYQPLWWTLKVDFEELLWYTLHKFRDAEVKNESRERK